MNRKEKKILKTTIKTVAHHNRNLWWELKREIFDCDYQYQYGWQFEFNAITHRAIQSLSDENKKQLIIEWKIAIPVRPEKTNEEILLAYEQLIIDEVVERARAGAYRTVNW